jgi:uncharacterized membrane protein YagU involved in acid resistance
MSATTHPTTSSGLTSRTLNGALAGIAGGMVFGMLMAMMGMLPTVAKLAGSDSPVVGGLVHLVISAGTGALFAAIVPATRLGALLGAGAVYAMIWWVLGPLVIMPARLGMPLFTINQTAIMSLMGHVIYGLVTAAVLFGLRRRARS